MLDFVYILRKEIVHVAYRKAVYGAFSVDQIERKRNLVKSGWNSFSVPKLTHAELIERRKGLHGDGLQKLQCK